MKTIFAGRWSWINGRNGLEIPEKPGWMVSVLKASAFFGLQALFRHPVKGTRQGGAAEGGTRVPQRKKEPAQK